MDCDGYFHVHTTINLGLVYCLVYLCLNLYSLYLTFGPRDAVGSVSGGHRISFEIHFLFKIFASLGAMQN